MVELELLLSVELLRLSAELFFARRRLAKGAVATSCKRKPCFVARWKASIVAESCTLTELLFVESTPGVLSGH